jgi:threonyl-tRNA synthetase
MKTGPKKYLIFTGNKRTSLESDPYVFLGFSQNKIDVSAIMKEMEIIQPSTLSGKGFYSLLPRGQLMSKLIQDFITDYLENTLNAFQIKTPFIYKLTGDEKHLRLFEDRVYSVRSPNNESFLLKPNADLGLFHICASAQINKDSLPLRIYEKTPCCRYVLSGELAGIKKAREFILFDHHSFCADEESALNEYFEILKKQKTIQKTFTNINIEWFKIPENLLSKYEKVILTHKEKDDLIIIELVPEKRLYWEIKSFSSNEDGDRLFHLQFDYDNPINYGINYSDSNQLKPCVIIHNSLGTIERWLMLFIKDALKKPVPVLPLWLSPTQVRILPLKDANIPEAIALAKEIRSHKIRVDVDDRNETLGNKIRNAEKEWIPYAIVFGDKEIANQEILPVRQRGAGQFSSSLEDLITKIKTEVGEMPYKSLPNWLLSKRPIFHG